MGKKLYICSTYYHVYITLLKCFQLQTCADIVICDDIPTGGTLTKRLKQQGLFQNAWFVSQSTFPEERGKNMVDWVFFQHRRRARRIAPLLPFSIHDYADIYIFHDGTPLGMYLNDAKKPYHLIEDSMNFYQRIYQTPQAKFIRPNTLKKCIRKWLNSGYFPLGESRYIKTIEVNCKKNVSISSPKIFEYPRNKLVGSLNSREKAILLDIFEITQALIPTTDKPIVLLLSQAYVIDSYMSQDTYSNLLKSMVENLNQQNYFVLLKPHPREDVTKIPLDLAAIILPSVFPVELLHLGDIIPISCVATHKSTGIDSFPSTIRKLYWENNTFTLNPQIYN